MLPTDNTKRLLLHQHLLHSRFAQQLAVANGRQLPTASQAITTMIPNTVAAAAVAASTSTASPLPTISPVAGLSRDNGNGFQAPPQVPSAPQDTSSKSILHMLLIADQERRLKRRLSEIQQLQQQQQQQQQHILLQGCLGPLERESPKINPSGLMICGGTTSIAARSSVVDLVANGQQKIPSLLAAAATATAAAPSSRDSQDVKQKQQQEFPLQREGVKEKTKDDNKGGREAGAGAASSTSGVVSRKDARWHEMYNELKAFRAKTGTCIVPRGFAENPRLASWVAEQRKQYKLMRDGRQSSITPKRVELLNQVEFAWNAQEAAWEKHMADLRHFREEHRHCHCPLNDPTFPKLGLWVKEQRRHYTLMKQGKQSHMTEARRAELESVGFCWDTHEATWLERLNELREYKARMGHCIVPTNYPQNPKLGTWIHHQRRQYKKFKDCKPCHITAERIRALDSLGFVWHPRDKNACAATATETDSQGKAGTDPTNLDLRPRKRQRQS